MQTHIIDGVDNAYQGIESKRLFEVQKYLSVTNHIWGGYWFAANLATWNALPADIRTVVSRNAQKYTLRQRRDEILYNDALPSKLKREGMIFNVADTTAMRARLKPYYARWKAELGSTAWDLLEAGVGKLG